MTLPEVRSAMHTLADIIGGSEGAQLHWLAEQTRRRSPRRRAPPQKYNKITVKQVQDFFRRNPTADYMRCAAVLGSNIGRVSEKVAGYRR